MKGQYRYILTRLCLTEGSLTIQKSLEPLVAEGISVLKTEKGDEYAVTLNAKQRRIHGLKPYYDAYQLNPNDVLRLEHAGSGVVQVSVEVKAQSRPAATQANYQSNYPRPVVPPPPQRVVVEESAYLREVRLERRAPAPALEKPAQKERQEPAATQRPQRETPAQPERLLDRHERQERQERQERPAVEAKNPAPRQSQQPVQNSAAYGREPQQPGQPAYQAPTLDPLVERFAREMGYHLRPINASSVVLEAQLGVHAYSVLLSTRADWDLFRQSTSTYRALLVSELGEVMPPSDVKVTQVTREAMETLLSSNRMGSVTPVELRGYWNTDTLTAESARSISEITSRQLGERGVFSQVMLSLSNYPAHTTFKLEDLMPQLEGVVDHDELLEILMTLTRQPFLALNALPKHEFYVRYNMSDLLGQLSEYARGLQVRLKVTGPRTLYGKEAVLR
ncbi:hypothetical protein [Deinococcus cellulosilyticus]|uniref:Uncharacterized protein n=1 Tax=Deinococcus cellulosilyticus (strain DSM 18568 / NBRC 106333 / KACC 11606 / 5516J-15) TaxID=1223518 RepID=A0A511N7V1_DEIC1|nr:hypothetical protein [Deinococcus cellulosilyticus]GEM48914.1 hypothetical protein DC3_45490 [Deinococcus cellulosilyticus NBRC 106333 = KACC 11606]